MEKWRLIGCFALLCSPALAAQPATRTWDFETDAAGWKPSHDGCGIVAEPDGNHAYQIVATRPHHTRIDLIGSGQTPNFVASLRFKVLEHTGAWPGVFVYGRSGRGVFRCLSVSQRNARLFCWYGRGASSPTLGSVPVGFTERPEWLHVAFGCYEQHAFAKVWLEGAPEPSWQMEGIDAKSLKGRFGLGLWTSPRRASTAKALFDDVSFTPLTKDTLKQWGIRLEPRPALDVAALPKQPGVFAAPQRLGLAGKRCALAFDRETGEITNFVDVPSGQEFIASQFKRPLFQLALTKPYAGQAMRLNSRDFRTIKVSENGQRALAADFGGLAGCDASVRVTAALASDDSIRLRIRVTNKTDWCVAGVLFPSLPAPAALGRDDSDDALLMPWASGGVLSSPGRHSASRTADYPGSAFAQFYALYDAKAGAYVAMHDADGNCKRFLLRCSAGQSARVDLEHLFPEVPGHDAALPYDVVLRTFTGDWRDAAAIYKAWAVKQPWCAKRLSERGDIAQFLKDGSGIIIAGGIHSAEGRARTVGERLEKLPALMDAYRQRTGLRHMIFVPYGWENRGTWAGINYLPAVPSNELWRRANAELRKRGHRTAFLTSGCWWVVKRKRTGNGPAFDDTADFERRKAMCIFNADGSPWLVDRYDRVRGSGSWRGLSAALCHGSPDARETIKRIFLDVAALGVPLVSLDQEIGGRQAAPCYCRSHGHAPGYGKWMWTGFRDLCADILKDGKPVQPELGLFLENVSELAIPYMSTYWSRQFGEVNVAAPRARGVGLFSYLYHEYVTAIGAACVQGQGQHGARPDSLLRCRILANNLTRGLIQGPFMHDVPLETKDKWRGPVSRAYFSFCQPYAHFPEYLMLGKTKPRLRIECEDVEVFYWRRDARAGKPRRRGGPPVAKTVLILPAVTTGSFEAADGSTAAFVVNTTPAPRDAAAIAPAGKSVVVYRADRTEEKRFVGPADGRVELSLEPFGVRVLVMSQGD